MSEYKPGIFRAELNADQVAKIDAILAEQSSYGDGDYKEIDPAKGILPTVFPPGFNKREWCEIRLEMFWADERFDTGQIRAQAIAEQVAAVVGYETVVWMTVGSHFFYAESWG